MEAQEITFTIKDVGWLIGQLMVLAIVLWKGGNYINKIKQTAKDNKDENERQKEAFEEHKKIVFKKFTRVHTAAEKEKDENLKEFKELNKGISEIKGMLQEVLGRR